METNTAIDKHYKTWTLLKQTCDLMAKSRQRELRQFDLSLPQAAVLFILRHLEMPATCAEISRRLVREQHSVSGLLRRMEKKGLVKRVKDPKEKKPAVIVPTQKGNEAYCRSMELKAIHDVLSRLSENDLDKFTALLQHLREKVFEQLSVREPLPFP